MDAEVVHHRASRVVPNWSHNLTVPFLPHTHEHLHALSMHDMLVACPQWFRSATYLTSLSMS